MRGRLSTLWVRNTIGAAVSLAAVGVLVATGIGESWSTYRHTVVPGTVVSAGGSGTADGHTWKVDSIRHLDSNPMSFGPPLPEGTVLTVITVDRSGPPAQEICVGVITDGQRRWNGEGVGGLRPLPPDGIGTICEEPDRVQFAFVLPRDVVPTALDVTTLDGRIMVRMLL